MERSVNIVFGQKRGEVGGQQAALRVFALLKNQGEACSTKINPLGGEISQSIGVGG